MKPITTHLVELAIALAEHSRETAHNLIGPKKRGYCFVDGWIDSAKEDYAAISTTEFDREYLLFSAWDSAYKAIKFSGASRDTLRVIDIE